MANHVSARTREFAVRMTIGADRYQIAGPILRESLVLTLIGLAISLPSALLLGRLVESQLYGVTANDPGTLAAAAGILILVTLLSAYLPARRAMSVDPMLALRYE
jgi:putative ABC transport system permease protein